MDDQRWAELERTGLSHRAANGLLATGSLTRVRHGVYGAPAELAAADAHRRLICGTWQILRPGAAVSHFSAAVLHGLPIPSDQLDRVWITRPGSSGKTTRWLHLCRSDLVASELDAIDGLVVTSLARTAVDVTRRLDLLSGLAVMDAALALGASAEDLADQTATLGHRAGARTARTALALADPRSESPGESRSRALMWVLGLPMPELQVDLWDEDGLIGRVDFLWRKQRLVGEFDGRVKYGRALEPGRDPSEVLWAEKRREDRIRGVDHGVVRWCWDDLFRPRQFDRRLQLALARTAPPPHPRTR